MLLIYKTKPFSPTVLAGIMAFNSSLRSADRLIMACVHVLITSQPTGLLPAMGKFTLMFDVEGWLQADQALCPKQ